MSRNLPAGFWFETITAVIGLSLFVLTRFTREWFEALTGLDPDGGNGALEFALAFGLLALAVTSVLLARLDYRRAATPA